MIRIQHPEELQVTAKRWKLAGEKIALVPTMGCLHAGHLSLVREARRLGTKVIATIFVNPIQFGPNEDFADYPRQLGDDCRLLEAEGVDLVFCPPTESMYTQGFQTSIRVSELAKPMCGAARPGHFDGVATVVSKLFNLAKPDFACFGEKDFQQLAIIRRLVEDLNFDVKIVGCPIVRESDGLAMSSRNKYLNSETRKQALCLYGSLQSALARVKGEGSGLASSIILRETEEIVKKNGGDLDYVVIVNERTLEPVERITSGTVMALAVKIADTVRLIDNAKLM